ncbi:MAG: hypothetical protein K2M16_09405 [Muribaculaceae bacterium]|nr:hypothetical protein [Muribaculaceae bacterium]
MRYDDDRYFDEEENDLWDDELELNSEDRPDRSDTSRHTYSPDTSYYTPDAYEDPREQAYVNHDNYHDRYNDGNEEEANNTGSTYDGHEDYYSDPEPEEPVKAKRQRFFGNRGDEDDDAGNDYYDSDAEPAPPVRKTKVPKLDPEDPDYWIEDQDSPLSGIITNTGKKWKWKLAVFIAILLSAIGAWIWFFRPYSDNAVKYGYIKNMERRGSLIKTFEGTMIPYKELGDPNPFYFQELRFSVASDSVAAAMKRMMLGCVPVRVEYETYHTPLPWKGEETIVVIKADTADPRKILPPEYR